MLTLRLNVRDIVFFAIPLLFFALWWFDLKGESSVDVPLRTDTFVTNPYAAAVMVGLLLAAATSLRYPRASLLAIGCLLLAQTLFWPARFSQLSWTGYLVLLVVAVAVGSRRPFARPGRGLASVIVLGLVVDALLNVPSLSLSGTFGTINGTPAESFGTWQGMLVWAVVITAIIVVLWLCGDNSRARRAARELPAAVTDDQKLVFDPAAVANLSSREVEIFTLAADGLSNAEIAKAASIEESTVKTHMNSIARKLGFTSRAQMIVYAYRSGVIPAAD